MWLVREREESTHTVILAQEPWKEKGRKCCQRSQRLRWKTSDEKVKFSFANVELEIDADLLDFL